MAAGCNLILIGQIQWGHQAYEEALFFKMPDCVFEGQITLCDEYTVHVFSIIQPRTFKSSEILSP